MATKLGYFDDMYLNDDDKKQMLDLKNQFSAADSEHSDSFHNAAEQIRAKYDYSGGPDGSQYVYLGGGGPDIPKIDPYESTYGDQIDAAIDKYINMDKFSYDPTQDPAFQSYLKNAMDLGEGAYQDNIASISSATGGRPNSYAAIVAANAKNKFLKDAQDMVFQFEDRAYAKYMDEKTGELDLARFLMDVDINAYNRYNDTVNRALEKYSMELEKYAFDLDQKRKKFEEAWDRTQLTTYVSNEDALILGVPPGTPSIAAQERAEDYRYWGLMQDRMVKNEKELAEHQIALQEASAARIAAANEKAEEDAKKDLEDDILTTAQIKKINDFVSDFEKMVTDNDWEKMTEELQYTKIGNYITLLHSYAIASDNDVTETIVMNVLDAISDEPEMEEYREYIAEKALEAKIESDKESARQHAILAAKKKKDLEADKDRNFDGLE